jgi:pimeloyl-ACP methyl ester carboxylesterase
MDYEVHGRGKPMVSLHGAFGTAEGWAPVLPRVARSRHVIIIEQQGHGHTTDLDAPLDFDRMADATAALLRKLNAGPADVYGDSDGGVLALRLAIKYPAFVAKIAVLGANAGSLEMSREPSAYRQILSLPDDFAPPVLKGPYDCAAPDPSHWPVLVRKIKDLVRGFGGFSRAEIRSIRATIADPCGRNTPARTSVTRLCFTDIYPCRVRTGHGMTVRSMS